MTERRQALGKYGEDLACRELERRGYAILERRYRCRAGEIDVIARHGETLVFVEVKAREDAEFGDGADAITRWKQRHLVLAATDYLVRHGGLEQRCRFDVVAIRLDGGRPAIDVYENAFDAT